MGGGVGRDGGGATDKKEVAEAISALLAEKAPMLREYFSVDIDEETRAIVGLPVLVDGHHPALSRLPEFILSLAHEVDWSAEKECFRTCAMAIAEFYGGGGDDDDGGGGVEETERRRKGVVGGRDGNVDDDDDAPLPPPSEALATAEAATLSSSLSQSSTSSSSSAWTARHVLFPAMSKHLRPSKALATGGAVLQVACLQQLYRVFERC